MNQSRFPKRNYEPRSKDRPARGKPVARPRERDLAEPRPTPIPVTQPQAHTAWDQQASWYDRLQGDDGDDFYRELLLPAVLKRVGPRSNQRVLDIGCGQGVLGRALAAIGVASVGIDASPALIEAARRRAGPLEQHVVGDARQMEAALRSAGIAVPFDHSTLVMALQDLDPLAPVLQQAATATAIGGRVVVAMTHPCFRIPRRSSWGWDDANGVQYRRLDGYMSAVAAPIRTHPGQKESGGSTTSFHRPLSTYLNACGQANLAVIACDELCSHRRGTRGPKFGAEDRAAREFPLFLILSCVRLAGHGGDPAV